MIWGRNCHFVWGFSCGCWGKAIVFSLHVLLDLIDLLHVWLRTCTGWRISPFMRLIHGSLGCTHADLTGCSCLCVCLLFSQFILNKTGKLLIFIWTPSKLTFSKRKDEDSVNSQFDRNHLINFCFMSLQVTFSFLLLFKSVCHIVFWFVENFS